ncbi:hypothetical protein FE257_001914 [Aspergillus nanangensis]|uniref:Methyltransferase domain-containing protein n=1 Tax=Aspergillus nanangensis TaxID=2582783 RepID=A0AAD4CD58_ASPNN|nr:hypothetical protein FE257_001914 [Aspergillus nanangensis]
MTASKDIQELATSRGKYTLPFTEEEVARLRNQHEWIKGCCGGLLKAPVDLTRKGQRVLDSATADGYWMFDMQKLMPEGTEFVGFDIMPELQPPPDSLPSTINLQTQSLLEPFPESWQNAFDFVHQRAILPMFTKNEIIRILAQLIGCVKPGGWIQLIEGDASERLHDSRAEAFEMFHVFAESNMKSPKIGRFLANYLRDLGMVNIGYEGKDFPVGISQEKPELSMRGCKNISFVVNECMQNSTAEKMGMSEQQWEDLPSRLESDMRKYTAAVRYHIVWAQKPVN